MIYIQFTPDGHLRKWSHEPFDGGVAYGEVASGWRPIESAPKDGTRLLAIASRRGWEKNGEAIVVCAWHGSRWAIMGANPDPNFPDTKDECTPRLWQPAPNHIADTEIMAPPSVPDDGLVDALEAIEADAACLRIAIRDDDPKRELIIRIQDVEKLTTSALAAYRGEA